MFLSFDKGVTVSGRHFGDKIQKQKNPTVVKFQGLSLPPPTVVKIYNFSVAKATLEIALSISPLVSPFVSPFHQESSRSTLLINQLYSSIDFNHHSSFQL